MGGLGSSSLSSDGLYDRKMFEAVGTQGGGRILGGASTCISSPQCSYAALETGLSTLCCLQHFAVLGVLLRMLREEDNGGSQAQNLLLQHIRIGEEELIEAAGIDPSGSGRCCLLLFCHAVCWGISFARRQGMKSLCHFRHGFQV